MQVEEQLLIEHTGQALDQQHNRTKLQPQRIEAGQAVLVLVPGLVEGLAIVWVVINQIVDTNKYISILISHTAFLRAVAKIR